MKGYAVCLSHFGGSVGALRTLLTAMAPSPRPPRSSSALSEAGRRAAAGGRPGGGGALARVLSLFGSLASRGGLRLLCVLLTLGLGGGAMAQEGSAAPTPEAGAEGPTFVPPQLASTVDPVWPPEARAQGLTGIVEVEVEVGINGRVRAVEDARGPELLIPAARDAARLLRFEPATEGGVPVVAHATTAFYFGGDADAEGAIVVVGSSAQSRETHAHETVSAGDLERAAGADLAQSIASVPGVTLARGTADSTKPIIRGHPERRLLILYDGVRHESQKWGSDHATEIDPFSAGEIDVIKGAAGVRYGADAMGGVVLVDPPPMRDAPGVGGEVRLVGVTNGRRGVAAARLEGASAAVPGLSWRVEGDLSRGAALSTPTYVLGNTGSRTWNAGGAARYLRDGQVFTLAYHHFDLLSGVCYCVNNSSTEDFLAQLDQSAPTGAAQWTTRYTIDRPFQAVTHDLAMARGVFRLGDVGSLKATYAFQINLRQESEQTRQSVVGPQYDFTLRTHSLDLELEHTPVELPGVGPLEGGAGLAGSFQENVYRGLPLIPNHRALSGSAYVWERLDLGALSVSAGGRYDHQSRATYMTESSYRRHLARGTLSEEDCALTGSAARCPLTFDTGSVTLGGDWAIREDRLDLRLDLSSASRFPNADELYMNGSAPTFPVYALGDPSLKVETTWGASPTLHLATPWLDAEASGYANYIHNYIYFAPEIGEGGAPAFDVTAQGAFPRFTYSAVDAVFYGVDGGVTLVPQGPFSARIEGAVVRTVDLATGEPLLFIPPDRVSLSLSRAWHRLGPLWDVLAEVTGQRVAEQRRVDASADLAPPPAGYTLIGASLGAEAPLPGDALLKVGLEATNLLNARYRDYTSLLRYYADEPGRSVRLRLGVQF